MSLCGHEPQRCNNKRRALIEFQIRVEYIELGQLLKAVGAVGSGGDVKAFLETQSVLVNGEPEVRRGLKLRPGDRVRLPSGDDILMT